MGRKVTYMSDGRFPVIVDMEDLELAELYLKEGNGHLEVVRIFIPTAGLSGASNIVFVAEARLRGDFNP